MQSIWCDNNGRKSPRRGVALVEMAVVTPVFFLFLFTLFEFAHVQMVSNMLRSAAKQAARLGVANAVTTAQVEERAREILSSAFPVDAVTISVKDAGVFDSPQVDPENVDYDSLPPIELSEAEPRQLFVIHITVPYDAVSVMPPMFVKGVTLRGQSVMRHE